ncbi:MAG: DNA primase small subunit domain-containing protein [Nanoarchaeota archaeon]
MIHVSTLLRHYKQRDIQEALIEEAEDKEVAVRFGDYFGKRPDVLRHPSDVLEFAKKGATSFHISEERWRNPLQLTPDLQRSDLDELRIGWDLVLDIDCHVLDYSKVAAELVINALRHQGIRNLQCKFSGNKGFHIGVPFEAFPNKIGNHNAAELFPDAARRIALYIKEMIKHPLGNRILESENGDFSAILKKTGLKAKTVQASTMDNMGLSNPYLNVEPFLDIDTILISSRHLYRMSYSFNEKSGYLSIPVNPKDIPSFSIEQAKGPQSFNGIQFLKRRAEPGEARKLLIAAYDFSPELPEEGGERKEYELPEEAIPEGLFPPCMQAGLKGLQDGKKRYLFALTNFLVCAGWDYDAIEARINDWNKVNPKQLRQVNINGHLRYHQQHKKKILPPNCRSFYEDLRICLPDQLCNRIKNPVSYAKRKTPEKAKRRPPSRSSPK